MKVNGHPSQDTHGAAVRLVAKARSGAPAAGEMALPAAASAPKAPSAPAAPAGTAAPAQVESTVEMAARKAPPGLVRVAARLEAMDAQARTDGQSNALAQITRNLQRYTDNQGLAPAAAPAPVPAPPEIESAPAADAPVATTGAEQPASA